MVGCHIFQQPLSLPNSSLCILGLGDVPVAKLQAVVAAGFPVFNHTFSHIGFHYLQASDIIKDVRMNEVLIDSLNQPLGLKLLVCPGFDCAGIEALNTQPDLAELRGPVFADVGGGFYTDSIMPLPAGIPAPQGEGGDWWFYLNNLPVEFAGYYYVRDITNFGSQHGVVVLLHTRTEVMTGSDGSRSFYPVRLLQYIINNVPAGFTFAPIDGIPGLLGNIRTTEPEMISSEFGTNDGQGRVVAGSLAGNGKASFCKARNSSVYCLAPELKEQRVFALLSYRFMPNQSAQTDLAVSWYDVADPDWSKKYNSQFWLVDLNLDGRDDLVVPTASRIKSRLL